MIRVQITGEPKGHGKFTWTAEDQRLGGLSRQPLLDACRALAAIGLADHETVGLYRGNRLEMSCQLGYGRRIFIRENNRQGPYAIKWSMHPKAVGEPTGEF
jgi:hypothetical protein